MRTTSWIAPQGLFESPGMLRTPDDLDGVRCVLSNDKGAWTFTSPGRIKVLRSLQPLQIECRHDRYHPARTVLNCVSPRQKAYEQRQRTKAGAIITAPAIVTAAVLAPPLGAALLAQEAAMAGLATHDANDMRGQDPDLCNYGSTMLVLTPRWP